MGLQQERTDWLAVAVRAAAAGAAVIRDAAPDIRNLDWRSKGPTDFVSEVDLAAEAAILAVMGEGVPRATVLAEESAASVPRELLEHGVAIVVDPLDGTTNFLHGYPEYAVSIAILVDGEPVVGVVHDVPGDEVFTARAGGGAQLNGQPIRVSDITDPQRALIGTGFPFRDPNDIDPYHRQMAAVMAHVSGVRRPGAASIDLASVACGRFDGFWEMMLSPWDFAAGMLLVREAGGRATDMSGAHLTAFGPSAVLAGNPAMHRWLQNRLNQSLRTN
ncbi:inositol monophosphatase family protein [Pseudogemmatithrix spongiicola]|uniref:Inositol-1-monophosphatase n=1 Tax=Pseudogemmatithrix spongiicola TaxID=3062599 RepID=A0AA49Q6V3_9BACT|nr:inositol monophosphatase family protein [Gemmatimonadaceae bacterium 'strain 138']WKW14397.1 inositol monophosphatase family protein [Gemmatimonadaceae bacterium 'strain 318']